MLLEPYFDPNRLTQKDIESDHRSNIVISVGPYPIRPSADRAHQASSASGAETPG